MIHSLHHSATKSCSPLCISLLGNSTYWAWCVSTRCTTVINTQSLWLEPHSPCMTQSCGCLITHLVTNVHNAEHLFLCSHNPCIPPFMPPAAGYRLSSELVAPVLLWIRDQQSCQWPKRLPHKQEQYRPILHISTYSTHGHHASKAHSKDTTAHNKSEMCESDFLIQAITHIIQLHFWIICVHAHARTHSKRTRYQTKSQQEHARTLLNVFTLTNALTRTHTHTEWVK